MCKSFANTNTCRYGARCRFIHDETPEELAAVPRGVASVNLTVSAPSWDEIKEASADASGRFGPPEPQSFDDAALMYRYPGPQPGYESYFIAEPSSYMQPMHAMPPPPQQPPPPPLQMQYAQPAAQPEIKSPPVNARTFAAEAKPEPPAEPAMLFAPVDLDARQLPVARTAIGLSTLATKDSSSSLSRQGGNMYPGSLRQSSSLPMLRQAWPSAGSLVLGLPPTSPVLSPTLGASKRNNSVTFDPASLPETSVRTPPGLPRASTTGDALDKSGGGSRLAIFRNISDQDLSRLTVSAVKPVRPPLASARLPSFERLSEGSSVGLHLSDTEATDEDEHVGGLNF